MRSPEHIDPHEHLQSQETSVRAADAPLHENARGMYAMRLDMLHRVRAYVSAEFHETLRKKIAYEQYALNTLLEARADHEVERREQNRILPTEYFVQKQLPSHLI